MGTGAGPPGRVVLAGGYVGQGRLPDLLRNGERFAAEPTERVAARHGVSGAAIAKVCRCLRIPKPPRGYWAQKAAGQRTARRPKLPPFDDMKAVERHR